MKKLPPIEKIPEAWTALADDRVISDGDGRYSVRSSDGAKTYTVIYNAADDKYASNDSATFWQGYPGYPVLAVMMLQGKLPYNPMEAAKWRDINWNALNKKMKRNYAAAVDAICTERNIDRDEYEARARATMEELASLPAAVKRLTGVKP